MGAIVPRVSQMPPFSTTSVRRRESEARSEDSSSSEERRDFFGMIDDPNYCLNQVLELDERLN